MAVQSVPLVSGVPHGQTRVSAPRRGSTLTYNVFGGSAPAICCKRAMPQASGSSLEKTDWDSYGTGLVIKNVPTAWCIAGMSFGGGRYLRVLSGSRRPSISLDAERAQGDIGGMAISMVRRSVRSRLPHRHPFEGEMTYSTDAIMRRRPAAFQGRGFRCLPSPTRAEAV